MYNIHISNLALDKNEEGKILMIKLSRKKQVINSTRVYKVLIDGNYVSDIKNGETKSLETALGEHQIQIKVDWCYSNPVEVKVQEGITEPHLEVLFDSGFFGAMLRPLFSRKKYLTLSEEI